MTSQESYFPAHKEKCSTHFQKAEQVTELKDELGQSDKKLILLENIGKGGSWDHFEVVSVAFIHLLFAVVVRQFASIGGMRCVLNAFVCPGDTFTARPHLRVCFPAPLPSPDIHILF